MFLNKTLISQSREPFETPFSLEIIHFSVPSLGLEKPCRLFTRPHHLLSTTVSVPACHYIALQLSLRIEAPIVVRSDELKVHSLVLS